MVELNLDITILNIIMAKLKIAIILLLSNFNYSITFIFQGIVIPNMDSSKYVSTKMFAKRIGKVSSCV